MQINQGNHNHNENTEYHYYGNYVQQEETHVHMYEETDGMPEKKIYDISRLHGIKKFIFISIFAVVTIIRICSFGFFVILNLIAGLMKKFLALYFVLIGIMVISGLMGDTIPWLSIIILTIILGILYLLCESTEMGYGYFGRFLNMLLDNLYYRFM